MGQLITDQPIVKFSGKHRGLSLYLARLLKPLWNRLVLDIGAQKNRTHARTQLALRASPLPNLFRFDQQTASTSSSWPI
jgi:hypothetical protein